MINKFSELDDKEPTNGWCSHHRPQPIRKPEKPWLPKSEQPPKRLASQRPRSLIAHLPDREEIGRDAPPRASEPEGIDSSQMIPESFGFTVQGILGFSGFIGGCPEEDIISLMDQLSAEKAGKSKLLLVAPNEDIDAPELFVVNAFDGLKSDQNARKQLDAVLKQNVPILVALTHDHHTYLLGLMPAIMSPRNRRRRKHKLSPTDYFKRCTKLKFLIETQGRSLRYPPLRTFARNVASLYFGAQDKDDQTLEEQIESVKQQPSIPNQRLAPFLAPPRDFHITPYSRGEEIDVRLPGEIAEELQRERQAVYVRHPDARRYASHICNPEEVGLIRVALEALAALKIQYEVDPEINNCVVVSAVDFDRLRTVELKKNPHPSTLQPCVLHDTSRAGTT